MWLDIHRKFNDKLYKLLSYKDQILYIIPFCDNLYSLVIALMSNLPFIIKTKIMEPMVPVDSDIFDEH